MNELFQQALEPPPDDGFSARVVARIRRRLVVRRAVLSLAAAAGAVVAAVPAYELVSNYGGTLAAALTGWAATGWTAEHQLVGAGLLIALLSPLLVRLVEE